jgi:hypothetical protein
VALWRMRIMYIRMQVTTVEHMSRAFSGCSLKFLPETWVAPACLRPSAVSTCPGLRMEFWDAHLLRGPLERASAAAQMPSKTCRPNNAPLWCHLKILRRHRAFSHCPPVSRMLHTWAQGLELGVPGRNAASVGQIDEQ